MQNDKDIPTIDCIIIDELSLETYKVELMCPSGKKHTHGLNKDEIEMKSHRGDHCSYCKDGYYLYLRNEEVLKWNQHKQNNK
ncbi:hypothetical protein KKC17_01135 [Patescibacteria group bacterium]|nr:hypothetical protein [Patescibacteria group bacterium]